MAPFAPRNDRSYRVMVIELMSQAQPGDVITYQRLGEALGLDVATQRDQIRQSVAAARSLLLSDHQRAIVAVRSVGYRIAYAHEHAGIAQIHRNKADRQVSKALDVLHHTDESAMSAADLQRHRATQIIMTNLVRRMTAQEERLQALEQAVLGPAPLVIRGQAELP
jgi:DNA-binding winged helix-turn-helix (wHTH) protein